MLTYEQKKIVDCDINNGKIKLIQAFAGTGKTTTLRELTKVHNDKRILYLSFNKALVEDNKFGMHVDSNTIHGLAYKEFEKEPKFIQGKLNIQKVCKLLHVKPNDADTILKALNYFCASPNSFPKLKHIYHIDDTGLKNPQFYVEKLQELWKKIESFDIPVPHDAYLKIYMLKNIKLEYDLVLVDEIQDVTSCILKILLRNDVPKVFVGDIHQQIYAFRYVINAYDICTNCEHFQLTKSFRYGGNILNVVNDFLYKFKNEKSNVEGLNETNVHYSNIFKDKYTYICRTNRQLMNYALYLATNQIHFRLLNKKINWQKESEIYTMLKDLKERSIVHEYLHNKFNISSYNDAILLFEECKNHKWLQRISILEEHDNIYSSLEQFHSECSEIKLVTCHMSKGLEFDNVVMGNDFSKVIIHNNVMFNYDTDTYNLIYVCMTRAKENLVLNNDILNFVKICYPVYFENSKVKEHFHPCIKCGILTGNVLSFNPQKLPYFISKTHKITLNVCEKCNDDYKKLIF